VLLDQPLEGCSVGAGAAAVGTGLGTGSGVAVAVGIGEPVAAGGVAVVGAGLD
jgi:hypothetical protein